MTTRLTKAVTRVAPSRDERRDLVVMLTPEGVYVREHGLRKWWGPVPYRRIMLDAVTADALRERPPTRKTARRHR